MRRAERPRLLVLASHPVPYWTPFYRAVAKETWLDVLVAYGDVHGVGGNRKRWDQEGFRWAGDLLSGYPSVFLRNIAPHADPSTRFGKINPGIPFLFMGFRPDVVLMNGYSQLFHALGYCSAWLARVPLLYVSDASVLDDPAGGVRAFVRERVLRWLYSRIERFLYIGVRHRQHFEKHGVPSEKLVRFAFSADNHYYEREGDRLRPRWRELRRAFGLPEDRAVVLFVARLEPWKRADLLVSAVGKVDEVHALIVGAGSEEARLKALARKVAPGRVTFAGFLNTDRLPEAYAASDLLVLPSDREPWGLVCNEALASGIPIIASDRVGAAADLVQEGRTGWVFHAGDANDLARVLRGALPAVRSEAERFRYEGRALVREYGVEAQVEGLRRAFESLGLARSMA